MSDPRCPVCAAVLMRGGVEVQGCRWFVCTNTKCATPVLIRVSDSEVLRIGKAT